MILLKLYKIKIIDSLLCQCGFSNQDLDHVTWHCINFTHERIYLFKKLEKCKLYSPYSISSFLAKPDVMVMQWKINFLKKFNLYV